MLSYFSSCELDHHYKYVLSCHPQQMTRWLMNTLHVHTIIIFYSIFTANKSNFSTAAADFIDLKNITVCWNQWRPVTVETSSFGHGWNASTFWLKYICSHRQLGVYSWYWGQVFSPEGARLSVFMTTSPLHVLSNAKLADLQIISSEGK